MSAFALGAALWIALGVSMWLVERVANPPAVPLVVHILLPPMALVACIPLLFNPGVPEALNRAYNPRARRRARLEADADECLRLIEYQPKPETYWQLKEIEWERDV